ncbi:glycoside hydrolase family 97 protein [Compostibacter hankyongensis]|uniref:Glycoside hydrolase family 97 protein n=1 Tax=Compostibacter hankyongensis TaxID=1007089 RepID=A0ABP8G0B1_9BACT
MKKSILLLSAALLGCAPLVRAQDYHLSAPDGKTTVDIRAKGSLQLSVQHNGSAVVPGLRLAMELGDGTALNGESKVRKTQKQSVKETIQAPVAIKNSSISNEYNELRVQYRDHYAITFRVYNDAVAYRFETDFPDSITVKNETCDLQVPAGSEAFFQWADLAFNSYEHLYDKAPLDSLTASRNTQLPLLLNAPGGQKILFTESDLRDYPGLYFTGQGGQTLHGVFPPAVKTERKNDPSDGGWDRNFYPGSTYDYIARTAGKRSFPWRIIALADNDARLLNNEIVYKLGAPSRLQDVSWIKPGQVAWDWWNHWNVTGVDFRAGVNTDTYKYYIDFAARHRIPYIIMDEGWYKLGNILERTPDVDMKAITDYGRQKGVGVILWCVWRTLDEQMEPAMQLFAQWGVKGVKVDFMNRDDQAVVNFYWRCAEAAARHHMLVDFHGAHKPAGILRTYPNVINFEGVAGLENDKWTDKLATPQMAVTLPYIRMFAGPMDYTPGAMRNAQQRDFAAINDNPMSLGTRCQQLAMYVVFDAPLQMLADNPTAYENEKESLDFITRVPTTWDQTIPLDGKVGEYVAMARRKGNTYFIGAMTNWTARDITLDLSFLPAGNHRMVLFRDGVNADRNGTDYKREERSVTRNDKLTVHLAPGGGWAARIE